MLGLNHVLTIIDKLTSEQANFLSRLLGLEKEIIRKCHFISTNFGCIDARTEIATSTSQLLVHSPLSSIGIQTQSSSTRSFLAVFHPSTVLAQSCFFLTHTVLIKLVLPLAAQLGIHFSWKNCNAAPPQGTCLGTHY